MESAKTDVTIYGATWCAFCHTAKAYLNSLKVPFKDIDVDHEAGAAEELVKMTGMSAVPVIKIGDEVIVGFDRQRIDLALRSNKLIK